MLEFSFTSYQIDFMKIWIDLHTRGGSSILCYTFFSSRAKIPRATVKQAGFHLPVKCGERFQLAHILIWSRRVATISSILTQNFFQTLRTLSDIVMSTPTPSANKKKNVIRMVTYFFPKSNLTPFLF